MQFSPVVLFAAVAAASGVNCGGSGFCPYNTATLQVVHDQISKLIAAGGGNRHYKAGEQIACSHGIQGYVCAFYGNGASGTARDVYAKVDQLIKYGCRQCGSVPTNGNNVAHGELVVDYVRTSCCGDPEHTSEDCYCKQRSALVGHDGAD